MPAALSEVTEPVADPSRDADAADGGRVVALPTVAELAALPGVSTAGTVARARVKARWTEHVLPQGTEAVLPVRRELRALLPDGGLRRGSTVSVRGSTSLLFALLSEAIATGSWAAAVGMPNLGLVAAGEFGVEVDRLALVPRPGADLVPVTAALLDGMDLVVVGSSGMAPPVARRLSSRARYRGAVLLSLGPWPGAELELEYEAGPWAGIDTGSGYLRARQAGVRVTRRGAAARLVDLGWEAAVSDLGQEGALPESWEAARLPAARGWGEVAELDWGTICADRQESSLTADPTEAIPAPRDGGSAVSLLRNGAGSGPRDGEPAVLRFAAFSPPREGELDPLWEGVG